MGIFKGIKSRLLTAFICLGVGFGVGFGAGVYALPILTAEKGLSEDELTQLAGNTTMQQRTGEFVRELTDSDAFHWGEGKITVTADKIWLEGALAPGPDYRLYLTPEFVDTESGFKAIKNQSAQIAPIKAFRNFAVDVPMNIDVTQYGAVLIWCEAFNQFITAAPLR